MGTTRIVRVAAVRWYSVANQGEMQKPSPEKHFITLNLAARARLWRLWRLRGLGRLGRLVLMIVTIVMIVTISIIVTIFIVSMVVIIFSRHNNLATWNNSGAVLRPVFQHNIIWLGEGLHLVHITRAYHDTETQKHSKSLAE